LQFAICSLHLLFVDCMQLASVFCLCPVSASAVSNLHLQCRVSARNKFEGRFKIVFLWSGNNPPDEFQAP
jgi:hypothetical protein